MKNTTTNLDKLNDSSQQTNSIDDTNSDHSGASTNDRKDAEKSADNRTRRKKNDLFASMNDLPELPEHYKNLQHDSNDGPHHPIPSLPPVPHHAPPPLPQDSSELLSPWWSEELPEVAAEQAPENIPPNDVSHYLLAFQRQATDTSGKDVGQENCYLWTKEPQPQPSESSLANDMKKASITSSSISLSRAYSSGTTKRQLLSTQKQQKQQQQQQLQQLQQKQQQQQQQQQQQPSSRSDSQCAMVCLFRESQERKMKKRQSMNLSSSWNPFYGNWLVVVNSRSALLEHIYETNITKKDSSDYYTMDMGEEFGQASQYVTNFMTRTFLPVQQLGRRYIESWRDGTQLGFFTKFIASAKRGDAFFLLRDSARRILDNNIATNDKKNDDDDHKR